MTQLARWRSLPRAARNMMSVLYARHRFARRRDGVEAGRLGTIITFVPSVLSLLAAERRPLARWLRTGDTALAAQLRRKLVGDIDQTRPLPDDLFGPAWTGDGAPDAPPVILIPIFNAPDAVDHLLARLPKSLAGTDHRILLIDDGSDDPGIAPRLAAFQAAHPSVTQILTLPDNVGFVGAVNAGLEMAREMSPGHIVLLNSDTSPPDGWLPRLLSPLLSDPSVASVTPLSNTAEILSVPDREADPHMAEPTIAALDAVAATFASRHRTVAVPTGIGFCMAMSRPFLDEIGNFDPAFGRGYGEEVDWCLKASAKGGRHVALAGLFVGHRGAQSFGAAAREERVATAGQLIKNRYPDYDAEVRETALANPIHAQRLALSIAWLAARTDDPVPIYLGHRLGGGAETALAREIDARTAAGLGSIVIRAGTRLPWRIEAIGPGFQWQGDTTDPSTLLALLAPVSARTVIYSCGVGAEDPLSVPRLLSELAPAGTPLTIRFHDHFPISPSFCLLDADGRYRSVPAPDTTDPAHQPTNLDGNTVATHREWRAVWAHLLGRARIEVFSKATRALVTAAYPDVGKQVIVTPHALAGLPERVDPGGRAIGILGGINAPKGAGVLTRLAQALPGGQPHRLVVIGEMDGAFRLPAPHKVLGRYKSEAIADLARQHDVGIWLMPSICPETFSFATHEMLATGLPVLTFDLGAQAEAARAAPNGHIMDCAPEDTRAILAHIEWAFGSQAIPTASSISAF